MQANLSFDRAPEDLRRCLHQVAGRVASQFPAVDGVGATVLLGDGAVFVGSNAFTDTVDEVQYSVGEGPCWAAVTEAREVRSTAIGAGDPRWPVFSEQAAALAVRSVVSTPIFAGDEVTGSLNLYSRSVTGLDGVAPLALTRSAFEAEQSLATARLLALALKAVTILAVAVHERTQVDLAIGVLMDRYRIKAGEASILLNQLARQDGLTSAAAAYAIVG